MRATNSGKVVDLWAVAMAVSADFAYLSPELKETMQARESEQRGDSGNDDWTAREYRRIG